MKDWADLFDELTPEEESEGLSPAGIPEQHRYLTEELIGEGAVKKVYRVQDLRTGRDCAMAVLKEPSGGSELFLREGRLCAFLQHPNIMPVYDVGLNEDGEPYFTMKLLEGSSLGERLRSLNESEVATERGQLLQFFLRICDATAYAHSRGVAHLDIKPDNIQIGLFGEVRLCDWGLARLISSCADEQDSILDDDFFDAVEERHRTLTGLVKGSPGYMAPEQTLGKSSRKGRSCDIYALGSVLYTILCGTLPVHGDTTDEILINTRRGFIDTEKFKDQILAVPQGLQAVCLKAMATNADERYDKVEDLIYEVEKAIRGFATVAEEAGTLRQMRLFYERNKVLCRLTVLFLMLMTISVTLFTLSLSRNEAKTRLLLEERVDIGRKAAVQYFFKVESAVTSQDQKQVEDLLEFVLTSDPQHVRGKYYKGLLEMVHHRFAEAEAYFRQVNIGRSKELADFCALYKTKASYAIDPFEVFKKLKSGRISKWHQVYLKERFEKEEDYHKKMAYLRPLLLMVGSNNKLDKDFILNYNDEGSYRKLDVSYNQNLKVAWYLRFVELDELDISHTGLSRLWFQGETELQVLNISHTGVHDLRPLNGIKLKKLNISHTQIRKLQPLWDCDLEELDLRETKVRDLSPLLSMVSLKRVYLDRNLYSESILNKLEKKLEILP